MINIKSKIKNLTKKSALGIFILLFAFLDILIIENNLGKNKVAQASTDPFVGFFSPSQTATAVTNANIALRQPDPRSDDLMIAIIAARPSSVGITTPSGWASQGTWAGTDGGAEGVDTGSVRLFVFSKVADGTEGTTNQTFVKTGTASVINGQILKYRSATGTYDVAAGGYSINSDATNWNGTPDGSVTLTAGDAVLIAGATNGDLSDHSAQSVAATSVTSLSTTYEHSEYLSALGNDIEFALAEKNIWGGTSTEDPTVTYTQSVASSGAVSLIRIRQGAGTNRTDTWVRSAGSQGSGGTSVNVPYPVHDIGEMLILFLGTRGASAPSTPSGWTYIGDYYGVLGTIGGDSGGVLISAYYREVTAQLTGTVAATIASTSSTVGQIISVHKDDVSEWEIDSDVGKDETSGTAWSLSGIAGINLDSAFEGDILLSASAINTDNYSFSGHALSAAGITFGEVTQTSYFGTNLGNDMALDVVTGRISAGSEASATVSSTSTSSGSTVNAPGGAGIFIKIIGLVPSFEQSSFRFFNNDNSADVGSALSAQNTSATLASAGDAFRLRQLIHISDAELAVSGQNFKLQFAEKSGTCDTSFTDESYADVTGATLIAYSNNAGAADGDTLTSNANDPTHNADTIVNQTYEEANNFTNSISLISAGQDGKWDFSLIDNGATAGTSYCFRVVKSDGALLDTYSNIPEIATSAGGGLSVDIVDSGGTTVGSPFVSMSPVNFSFANQTATGTFGESSQKVRVDNGTGTETWTLSLAADGGTTSFWNGASSDYDFNDPTAGALDGADADSLGGRMTIDPSSATITPEGGCTLTNISSGSSVSFSEGATDSITLAAAAAGADTGCFWDITDIDISQTIPAEQPVDSYSIDMTLSIIAS